MKVLVSDDGRWRAEQWPDGWRLYEHGGLMLQRATFGQVVEYLDGRGVHPDVLKPD